jgi:hypothetical protein
MNNELLMSLKKNEALGYCHMDNTLIFLYQFWFK